jgi:nucleotide-binding universal stress UspA family protein
MMTSDEKDRYGDKLRDLEKASENEWTAKRDRELLAKLRRQAEERATAEPQEKQPSKVFNRILCPIDVVQDSFDALDLAGRLASESGADLYLLHVCPTVFVPLSGPVTGHTSSEQSAKAKMEQIAARHLASVPYHILITTGEPAKRITNFQSALDIDLIIVGTHGRRGVPRFFLGSIAENVVREAACPVLTVRQD